jgi:transaldolase
LTLKNVPNIKIFGDGAVLEDVPKLIERYQVQGFTTNPTLMAKAGIKHYEGFAKKMLDVVHGLPVSLEVFADELPEMERQAKKLASWGDNVYVKVPITNTKRVPTYSIIRTLSEHGVKLNVTAVFTEKQIDGIVENLQKDAPAVISVFAGRIADVGQDPAPIIRHAKKAAKNHPHVEVLWASCREIYNVVMAANCGTDIITVPNDMLEKLFRFGKDLGDVSLETVEMFRNDAVKSGFQL